MTQTKDKITRESSRQREECVSVWGAQRSGWNQSTMLFDRQSQIACHIAKSLNDVLQIHQLEQDLQRTPSKKLMSGTMSKDLNIHSANAG